MDLFKTCHICQLEKGYLEFSKQSASKDGLFHYCKECAKKGAKLRYKQNPEKMKSQVRNWQIKNKEKIRIYKRRYEIQNPIARIRHYLMEYARENGAAKSPIGCSTEELKLHLEKQFSPEMNWENYGKVWGVYKKKNIADFKKEELSQLNHFSNLEPRILH